MLFFSLFLFFGFQNNLPANIELVGENRIVDEKPTSIFKTYRLNKRFTSVLKTDLDTDSYVSTKAEIDQLRMQLSKRHRQGRISIDDVKTEFTNLLVDKILPYWYGTPWSFEGHTAVPNQGNIACGYFISTTLRDMGLRLNRYKLAQKSPIDEARTISCGVDINSIMQESREKAFEEIDCYTQEGLYFIGFDKEHVGYLLKREGQLFLIHSNYFFPGSVCIEPFVDSRVFNSFYKFYLVDISNNDILIQRWLDNDSVLI